MPFNTALETLKGTEKLTTLTNEPELFFLYRTVKLLSHRPNVRILDCGTYSGVSAMIMAESVIDYGIDAHIDTVDDYSGAGSNAETIREVIQRREYGDTVTLAESEDIAFINGCPDSHYDFAYVDSLHRYKHVATLLEALLPKMKRLSYMTGHDYCLAEPGVMRAVEEWRKNHSDVCVGFGLHGRIWWTAIREAEEYG